MTMSDLVVVVKAIAPVLREYVGGLTARVQALETVKKGDPGAAGPPGPSGPKGEPGRDGRDGVAGPHGDKGADGHHGKDGADGLGFDDLSVLHDGGRGLTFRFIKGDRIRDFAVTVPALIYQGVYIDAQTYEKGDVVTWAGSTWHCHEATTTKPGDGSASWKLMVKRGRDGRDGHDAAAVPVVKVR